MCRQSLPTVATHLLNMTSKRKSEEITQEEAPSSKSPMFEPEIEDAYANVRKQNVNSYFTLLPYEILDMVDGYK